MSTQDEAHRLRKELEELEATRLRLSGAVMHGDPEALEEDRRLEERIREIAHQLMTLSREAGPAWPSR